MPMDIGLWKINEFGVNEYLVLKSKWLGANEYWALKRNGFGANRY